MSALTQGAKPTRPRNQSVSKCAYSAHSDNQVVAKDAIGNSASLNLGDPRSLRQLFAMQFPVVLQFGDRARIMNNPDEPIVALVN